MSQLKFPPERIGIALQANRIIKTAKATIVILPLTGIVAAPWLGMHPAAMYVGFFLFLLTLTLFFSTRIGPALWIRLGRIFPDLVADRSGLVVPIERLLWHKLACKVGVEERKDGVRQIAWSAVQKLQMDRDFSSKHEYVLQTDHDSIHISSDELLEPQSFEQTVEFFSGKRFEKTFDEREPRPVASISTDTFTARSTQELVIPPGATRFAVRPTNPVSRWFLAGSFARVIIGVALMFALAFLFPKSVLPLLDSGLGFILAILLLYLLVVYPLIPKARKRYFLAVAPEGLYAMVPAEDFPQFTPWKQIKDFTLSNPDEGEDKDHTSGRLQFQRREANERRFTLYTESGVYAFPLKAIEQDYLLLMKMREKKVPVPVDGE